MQENNCQNICRIPNNTLAKQLKEFEYSKLLRVEGGGEFHKTVVVEIVKKMFQYFSENEIDVPSTVIVY